MTLAERIAAAFRHVADRLDPPPPADVIVAGLRAALARMSAPGAGHANTDGAPHGAPAGAPVPCPVGCASCAVAVDVISSAVAHDAYDVPSLQHALRSLSLIGFSTSLPTCPFHSEVP